MASIMQKWIGYQVSLDCSSNGGKIEGCVSNVNPETQTISLNVQNGSFSAPHIITVNAKDIRQLKIVHAPEKISISESTNQHTDLICHGGRVVQQDGLDDNSTQTRQRSDSRKGNTPRKVSEKRYRSDRDEVCFGTPVDSFILENEFDFEKNLALFDKQAVFKKIDGRTSVNKNDGSHSHADNNNDSKDVKYKCDENVIESKPVTLRQITLPYPVEYEYVTDSGLIVPSITAELRRKIIKIAEKNGIDESRQVDMIGRAAGEMILQLLGGSHRFLPKNHHQKPSVVVLCGPDTSRNSQAVNCARHLANHCVNVTILISNHVPSSPMFDTELSLFRLASGNVFNGFSEVRKLSADILLSTWGNFPLGPMHKELADWITHSKAPVYSIDPDSSGETIASKWCLVPVLPLSYKGCSTQIYLCDLGIPHDIFSKVGINYHSPFGHKFIIPLHSKQ